METSSDESAYYKIKCKKCQKHIWNYLCIKQEDWDWSNLKTSPSAGYQLPLNWKFLTCPNCSYTMSTKQAVFHHESREIWI